MTLAVCHTAHMCLKYLIQEIFIEKSFIPRFYQRPTHWVKRPLPWASVHWLVQCTLECHWNATGWPSVHWDPTGTPLADPVYTGIPLAGHQTASGQVCKFSSYLELTALQWTPVLLLKQVSTSTSPRTRLGYIVFVYLGLQVKWNQFSPNNSYHTSCIHKGLHAGKGPDPMTSKPDSVRCLFRRCVVGMIILAKQLNWDVQTKLCEQIIIALAKYR